MAILERLGFQVVVRRPDPFTVGLQGEAFPGPPPPTPPPEEEEARNFRHHAMMLGWVV